MINPINQVIAIAIANAGEKPKDEDVIKEYFNDIAPKEEHKEPLIPKINPAKKPKWCLTKEEAEELNDKEDEKLIDFAQNLDYDKYMKDLDVREALYLIKNKIDDNEDHEFKGQEKEEEMNAEYEGQNEENRKIVETDPVEKLKNELSNKKADHDNDWNSSVSYLFNLLGESRRGRLQ